MAKQIKRANPQEEPQGDVKGKTAGNRAQVVKNLLAKVEEKMAEDAGRTTVGDYIRLVQLHKELDEEAPKEIKVTWVEPEATE